MDCSFSDLQASQGQGHVLVSMISSNGYFDLCLMKETIQVEWKGCYEKIAKLSFDPNILFLH